MSGVTRADDYAISVGIDADSDSPLPPPQIARLQFARRTGTPVGPPTTLTHLRLDGQVYRVTPITAAQVPLLLHTAPYHSPHNHRSSILPQSPPLPLGRMVMQPGTRVLPLLLALPSREDV